MIKSTKSKIIPTLIISVKELLILSKTYLKISFFIRIILIIISVQSIWRDFFAIPMLLTFGAFYDLILFANFFLILKIFQTILTQKYYQLYSAIAITTFYLIIFASAIVETIYWIQFKEKINIIDFLSKYELTYIIHVKPSVLFFLVVFCGIFGFFTYKISKKSIEITSLNSTRQVTNIFAWLLLLLFVTTMNLFYVTSNPYRNIVQNIQHLDKENYFAQKIAENTILEKTMHILSSYLPSNPTYRSFVISSATANSITKKAFSQQRTFFLDQKNTENNLHHRIHLNNKEIKHNVMLLVLHDPEYLKSRNKEYNLIDHSAYLRDIAKHSLYFSNGYVLEKDIGGTLLSILTSNPFPVIHEDTFSLAKVLCQRGYVTDFFYYQNPRLNKIIPLMTQIGHRAQPFIMNDLIEENDTLFTKAIIQQANLSIVNRKSFFFTISNLKPKSYTSFNNYPDFKKGQTDHFLYTFFNEAKKQSWYNNTIFIITFDLEGSKKTGPLLINPETYKVPIIFFTPGFMIKKQIETKVSQLDIAPTIAGFLNSNYISKFHGLDIASSSDDLDRVMIKNGHHLGYVDNDLLMIQSPHQTVEIFKLNKQSEYKKIEVNLDLLNFNKFNLRTHFPEVLISLDKDGYKIDNFINPVTEDLDQILQEDDFEKSLERFVGEGVLLFKNAQTSDHSDVEKNVIQ